MVALPIRTNTPDLLKRYKRLTITNGSRKATKRKQFCGLEYTKKTQRESPTAGSMTLRFSRNQNQSMTSHFLSMRIFCPKALNGIAYPVIDSTYKTATFDSHCQFCKKFSTTEASTQGLQHEIEVLARIKATVTADNGVSIWRYATATGESNELLPEGWVLDH